MNAINVRVIKFMKYSKKKKYLQNFRNFKKRFNYEEKNCENY